MSEAARRSQVASGAEHGEAMSKLTPGDPRMRHLLNRAAYRAREATNQRNDLAIELAAYRKRVEVALQWLDGSVDEELMDTARTLINDEAVTP